MVAPRQAKEAVMSLDNLIFVPTIFTFPPELIKRVIRSVSN
jgi:hypothetical protein